MLNNKGHVLAFDDSPIGENSPLDSITYNKIIDSLKTSVLRCINRSRDLTNNMSKLNKALAADNDYLMAKVRSMQIEFPKDSKTALVTGYDQVQPGTLSQAVQSSLSGQLIIKPINKWSKVIRYQDKNGRNRASKDISIAFGPTGSLVTQTVDSDIYNILDGYNDSYWIADTVAGQNYTIRIQFPASIKPYINYFSMIPFPAFGFKLNSVGLNTSNGSYIPLYTDPSQELGILDMHFKPMTWNGIVEINVTAQHNVIGIADLDIGLEDYYQSENEQTLSSFIFPIPALTDTTISKITLLDTKDFDLYGLENDSSYIKTDKIKAYLTTDLINFTQINPETFTGKASTTLAKAKGIPIYIKFSMQKYLGQTPIFRSVQIKYEV